MTRARLGWLALAFIATATRSDAQLPQTRLYAVFPPGAQAGTSVDLTVTAGEDIDELKALHFTHPGITAAPKMQEVNGAQRPVENVFVVTVAGDVPPGVYEVAAEGRFGASNSRRFVIGARPEVNETEGNNTSEQPSPLEFGKVLNGRMDGGTDVDWFKFAGTAGQKLVFDCAAATIDSRMSANLEVFDASGRRRLATQRSTHAADAALVFQVPSDGEYLLRVFDQTYRNGNDYFYRLTPHTGPRIAFVLPNAGLPGSTGTYSVYGWNLPGGQTTDVELASGKLERVDTTITLPADATFVSADAYVPSVAAEMDAVTWRLDSPQGPSNPVRVFLAQAPVAIEQEPNNEPVQSQAIVVPADVAGQFAARGDVDCFTFQAKSGEVLYIEAYGERLGSAADPYFAIDQLTVDANGVETAKRLGVQDDNAATLYQNVFDTQTDDAAYRLQVPADGAYRVSIRHRAWEVAGDASLVYRLVIRQEQPDFRVVAVAMAPTAGQTWPVGLRQGDNFPVNLLAFRRDGFIGAIDVTAADLPPGITCAGTTIGPNQTTATLVVAAASDAAAAWHSLRLVASAKVDDLPSVRAVEAARGAVANAEKPLPDLMKALAAENDKLQKATTARDEAQKAATEKPDDQGAAQKLEQEQKALDAAQAAQQQAADKVAAAERAVADAKATLAQAEQSAATKVRDVTRAVRAGSVVWGGQNNSPAIARVAETFGISVMPEAAIFQVKTDVFRLEANQSRQVLIPLSIEKRNGFDEKVALNFTGLPNNANIEAPNGAVEKGESSKVLRLFVKDNAPPGTYTFWLSTQAQVQYARNPEKAERLRVEHEAVAAETKTAMEAAQLATQAKNDAAQKATQAAETLTKAQADKTTAEKAAQTAATTLQETKAAKEGADKKLTDATAALKKSEEEITVAQKALTDAEAAVAVAEETAKAAQAALDADPNNEALKQQKADADAALAAAQQTRDTAKATLATSEQSVATAKQAAEVVQQEQTEAQKRFTDAETAARQADEALVKANELVTTADTANKAAAEAKVAAEKAEQEAQAAANTMEEKRKAAEKAATDAANAAKPQEKSFTPPSTPFVVTVKAAPVKLAANVANSGNVKKGETLEIKVTVTRQNGFAGPVTLTLPLPPGVTGLTANDSTIPADQTEGTLTITAAADATVGQLPNMVVRATMDFAGAAAVDSPVNITVVE